MKTINVPSREQVSEASQIQFDILTKRMGKVPNLYAAVGYSANALKGFMDFDESFSHGVFNGKEREAIALVVSEVNNCAYCLAGHTAAAMKRGFTKVETLDIRRGKVNDSKLDAIIQLAKSITENKGEPEEIYLDNFYTVGFNEAGLMELIGLITVRVFTNYAFAATKIPVDFPLAEALI